VNADMLVCRRKVCICFTDEIGHVIGCEKRLYGKEDCCVHGIMSYYVMEMGLTFAIDSANAMGLYCTALH
jgi:hypothetical protein